LENDLKNKKYKLEVDEICPILNAMALKKCTNESIWQPILSDLDDSIKVGSVNNIQIYYLLRSLNAVNMLDAEVTKQLVEYLVRRGYDSDNLM
jgi:hypothetical protein